VCWIGVDLTVRGDRKVGLIGRCEAEGMRVDEEAFRVDISSGQYGHKVVPLGMR
jgi:hypothetical protein